MSTEDPVWEELLGPGSGLSTTSMTSALRKLHGVYTPEQSSLIREATYIPEKKILTIAFRSSPPGETYTYHNVPEHVGQGFFDAAKNEKSIGKYFSVNIKKCFTFVKRFAQQVETEKE